MHKSLTIDEAVRIDGSGTGYELNQGVPFQTGDVFGVYLPTSSWYYLLHQKGETIETYRYHAFEGSMIQQAKTLTVHLWPLRQVSFYEDACNIANYEDLTK